MNADVRLGLIINFDVSLLKNGFKRVVRYAPPLRDQVVVLVTFVVN